MSTLPADADIQPPVTTPQQKVRFANWLKATRQLPGTSPFQPLTIASGTITPADGATTFLLVDTEGSAATDDLDHISVANVPEGTICTVQAASDARTVVVRHGQGGSGQILLAPAANFSIDDDDKAIFLQLRGTSWVEFDRGWGADVVAFRSFLGLGTAAVANTGTSSGNVPVLNGSGKLVDGVVAASNVSQHLSAIFTPLAIATSDGSNTELVLTSGLTGIYRKYRVEFFFRFSADTDLYMRVSSNGGVSYDSVATDYEWNARISGTTSVVTADAPNDNDVPLSTEVSNVNGTTALLGLHGSLILHQRGSASAYPVWTWECGFEDASTFTMRTVDGTAARKNGAAVDAIKFFVVSGTMTSDSYIALLPHLT